MKMWRLHVIYSSSLYFSLSVDMVSVSIMSGIFVRDSMNLELYNCCLI